MHALENSTNNPNEMILISLLKVFDLFLVKFYHKKQLQARVWLLLIWSVSMSNMGFIEKRKIERISIISQYLSKLLYLRMSAFRGWLIKTQQPNLSLTSNFLLGFNEVWCTINLSLIFWVDQFLNIYMSLHASIYMN